MADSITCPVCDHTSFNPNDIIQGYCGYCRRFTQSPEFIELKEILLPHLRRTIKLVEQIEEGKFDAAVPGPDIYRALSEAGWRDFRSLPAANGRKYIQAVHPNGRAVRAEMTLEPFDVREIMKDNGEYYD